MVRDGRYTHFYAQGTFRFAGSYLGDPSQTAAKVFDLGQVNNASADVTGGLTLTNAAVAIGQGANYGRPDFLGTQALGGTGNINFGDSVYDSLVEGNSGGVLTIGPLLGSVGDDFGDRVAVLIGMLGERSGEVTFEGLSPLAPLEVDGEGGEELGQFGQPARRSSRFVGMLMTNSPVIKAERQPPRPQTRL
ncbi:MAG: hypothetical protein JWN86_104 [Planctomycetota bacterium]|nr:hypothetical protein [Planctomycetota bacterium]